MAVPLSRLSRWIWPGSRSRRTRETPAGTAAVTNGLFPDSPSGFREPGAVGGGGERPGKGRTRGLGGRREARVDREHDMVIVPSDGGEGLTDSDSDCSDWSIGWLEPHAPELQSDGDDSESSFAVLVPCYRRRGRVERTGRPGGRFPGPGGVAVGSASDNRNFVDQWLSSLQN